MDLIDVSLITGLGNESFTLGHVILKDVSHKVTKHKKT